MNVLLITLGSYGDVHPFVGLGARLRRRGHRCTVCANSNFQSLIRAEGLGFDPLGEAEDYERLKQNPDLWHKRRAFAVVFGAVVETIGDVYDAVGRNFTPETVVVASSLALGARVAQDELRFPMATVHLAPAIFRSTIEPPTLPGAFMPRWLPKSWKRAMWDFADDRMIDPIVTPKLNAFRAGKGLPPVRRALRDWWNSPDMVIGMFPAWFAKPQADWWPQTRLTGFPLYDERDVCPMSPRLEGFLAKGDAPIAFTAGSAMLHAEEFFRDATHACVRLGRRGLLLTRHREQVPARPPANVMHVDYAPFSQLLPRVAALVHHGGIGTSAQALAAGVPQLVVPMTHDQPDNARRMRRLGVARVLPFTRFSVRRATRVLRDLLNDSELTARCRQIATRFDGIDALEETCDLVEQLGSATAPASRSPIRAADR